MSIIESIIIFTLIRYYCNSKREIFCKWLFVKDGSFSLQEKSDIFFDYMQLIGKEVPISSYFITFVSYIWENMMNTKRNSMFGLETNYEGKLFIKQNEYNANFLNIPPGQEENFVKFPFSFYLIALKKNNCKHTGDFKQ
jgi:hypothetical protein